MRKASNYVLGEAVDGKWKQELLIFLGKEFNLDTLVESGSCDGGTLGAIHTNFKECYTIELAEHYYNIVNEKFRQVNNVHCYHGNSAELLPVILVEINITKALFWLDAHSSGGLTANEGDPLAEEIRAIINLAPDSLIVIDDQQNADLCQVPRQTLEGYEVIFRTGVVLLFKKGLYQIPEFI